MVSDTRGNKSFLAVRMRKTSLLSLSLFLSSPNVAPLDTCHTRTAGVCRHSCRARISRRRNIDLRYTTKRVHLSWWETKPHGFVCSSFLLTFPSLSPPLFSTLLPAPKTRHNRSTKFFSVRDGPSPTFAAKFLARPSREPRPKQGETCQGRGMLGIPPLFGRPSLKARRNSRRRNVQVRSRSRNGRDVSRSVAGGGKRRGRTDWSERIAVAGSWVWGERERERESEKRRNDGGRWTVR